MLRLTLIAAAVLAITAGTAEAQSNCEINRRACLRSTNCLHVPPPQRAQCREDVETACAKQFELCNGPQSSTSPPVPTEPTTSDPTPSHCGPLFSRLLAYAMRSPSNRIQVVWSTNYYANGVRYAGLSEVSLRAHGRTLVGEGQRHRKFFESASATLENVSLQIRHDTSVMLSGQYGPYRATCSADRFAVLYTGDSVEILHFKVPATTTVEDKKPPKKPFCPDCIKEKDVAD